MSFGEPGTGTMGGMCTVNATDSTSRLGSLWGLWHSRAGPAGAESAGGMVVCCFEHSQCRPGDCVRDCDCAASSRTAALAQASAIVWAVCPAHGASAAARWADRRYHLHTLTPC